MRDLSGTGQVYRFTLSQLLKSRANRVTLIIMVLLAAVSMPLTALLGGETPETSDTAGLASVRVDNRTDLALDFSGDAYWADTDFSAGAGEPDAVVTITGDETGYQVAVNGSETAHAGELSQLAETARQAVRDACLRAAGLSSRQLEALTASTGEEDSHEEGFWIQYGYSILAMILCLMSASYVIRAVVEEKDSRLVELLLVSVKPMALLAGKILAVMAFTFGWLLAMLAGFGVSCGLTAGLMGPGVLQKQLSGLLAPGRGPKAPAVELDLFPAVDETALASLFAAHAAQTAGGSAADFWLGLLNQKLGRTVWSAAGLQDSDAPAVLTAAQWQKLAHTAKHWRFEGLTPCSWKQAQTTGGGLALREVDQHFQFKGCPGLYFVGETLDCAGSCGGFNLHWAFGSGLVAGRSAAGHAAAGRALPKASAPAKSRKKPHR